MHLRDCGNRCLWHPGSLATGDDLGKIPLTEKFVSLRSEIATPFLFVGRSVINNEFNARRADVAAQLIVAIMLLYSAALLLLALYRGESLGEWIWDRHQNQFSWYSRPLFLIPACYYAYRQRISLVVGFMVLLLCSLFWFAAPAQVPEHISGYLEWERQLFFSNDSVLPLILLVAVVVIFLGGLFYAFWRRSVWIGLLLINAGTLLKIVVSMVLGKEAGMAAIVPSLSSIAIINLVAFAILKFRRAEKSNPFDGHTSLQENDEAPSV